MEHYDHKYKDEPVRDPKDLPPSLGGFDKNGFLRRRPLGQRHMPNSNFGPRNEDMILDG